MINELFKMWLNPLYWVKSEKEKEIYKILISDMSDLKKEIAILTILHVGVELEQKILSARLMHNDISEYDYECEMANLTLSGLSLEEKLLSIQLAHNFIDQYDYDTQMIELKYAELPEHIEKLKLGVDHKYGVISEDEYKQKLLDFMPDGIEKEIAIVQQEYDSRKISENEYKKRLATINKESYIAILSVDMDEDGQGSFELDWNYIFIEELREAGYTGKKDEDVASEWMDNICKSVALEAFGGIGDFEEKLQAAQYAKSEVKK